MQRAYRSPSPPPPPQTMIVSGLSPRTGLSRARLRASIISTAVILLLLPAWFSLLFSSDRRTPRLPPVPPFPSSAFSPPLSLRHIVFGIASSSDLWPSRRAFLRLWWRPDLMRGSVWVDDHPSTSSTTPAIPTTTATTTVDDLPPIRYSEDTSRFRYTNPTGLPSGLRIARVVAESFRLGDLQDVRWFVLCDDDTIMSPDNLVAVLAKYDWREMVYVGGPSESHSANTYFSHNMAFGGGGIAISYPLARALTEMQDGCLERYPKLYGSDDRLHACISEIGVPLTREQGFHQWDIRGNAHGLLAGHPVAPFVSIHHVETVDPIYPDSDSLESLKLFAKAMTMEGRGFLQRSICYDRSSKLTFAVSVGYVVQVFPDIVLPRELERPEKTFVAWNGRGNRDEFDFDTRDSDGSPCKRPTLFFLKGIVQKDGEEGTSGSYVRARGEGSEHRTNVFCFPRYRPPLPNVKEIRIVTKPLREIWHLVPRRLCCEANRQVNGTLEMTVAQCDTMALGSVADSL